MATYNRRFAQLQLQTLAGSGVTIGDLSIILTNFHDIDGNLVTMTAFGTKGYGTLEPGSSDREEQISFTGITQNANGTATLTGVANVDFLYPYAETAGTDKSHPGGVTFVISNTSGFYDSFVNKEDDAIINGDMTFMQQPTFILGADMNGQRIVSMADPIANTDGANKEYVDGVAVAGAPNANETTKGIVQLATNAQMGAGTSAGGTGARLVPPNSQLVQTSSGAGDANKLATLGAGGTFAHGFIDAVGTWATVQSFPADNLQVTTDPDSANDAVRYSRAVRSR